MLGGGHMKCLTLQLPNTPPPTHTHQTALDHSQAQLLWAQRRQSQRVPGGSDFQELPGTFFLPNPFEALGWKALLECKETAQ